MHDDVPDGARLASRVILIAPNQSVLYLRAQEPKSRKVFWVMPGGGLDSGESFEDAAHRELVEEVGCSVVLGPYVWFRRHKHEWNGRPADQYERFFVAHAESLVVEPQHQDGYISRHRWWTLEELKLSKEEFAPRAVARLLQDIISGNYPKEPIDTAGYSTNWPTTACMVGSQARHHDAGRWAEGISGYWMRPWKDVEPFCGNRMECDRHGAG